MGDRRKLHGEIERCLKKVTEGVETFEDIWQKVHAAPNHNQKDRYEQELKREIKKLQRLRDQIKTWMSSPEIKDKKSLQDARKTIEQQMERFKSIERIIKTKAYSNGGLGAGPKLDPQEKEKEDCMNWIKEAIQELELQRDKFESDIESLSATLKKKKVDRDKQERLDELKRWMERHKYHISFLQKILRAIDNEAVDLKPIHDLRADIEYYVESNQESDFKENDMMYDGIDMDNLNTIMGPVVVAPTQTHLASASNGNSIISSNNLTTLMDITTPTMNIHSSIQNSIERMITTVSASNSTVGDSESVFGLTTPSSTQPSSPSASPALPSIDDHKRKKSDPDENFSQRIRSNSGANGSSNTTTHSHLTSPKNPLSHQHSPGVQLSTKNPLSLASTSSNNVSPHFSYSTSSSTSPSIGTVQPVLPYSAIVSQNPPSSTTMSSTSLTSKQQTNLHSPPAKQTSRQLSANINEPTVMNNSNPTNSTSISSHPLPLLAAHIDRAGVSNSQSQPNSSSSNVTVTNGSGVGSSLYTSSTSIMSSQNIPPELSITANTLDSTMVTQQLPQLSRTITETDRTINPNITSAGLTSNGLSDGHGTSDNSVFTNFLVPPTSMTVPPNNNTSTVLSTDISSTFLSTANLNDLPQSSNGRITSQLSDHYSFRYSTESSSSNQQLTLNNRVSLTNAEIRTLKRLNSAYNKLPALLESERQRANTNCICGRNPLSHSQIIPYYPQVPPATSDTPEFYYRLAPETLFFIFYYMEGTRAQYLAAKALKRQSWRFHTKHMMWFQRHEEPKTITDDYEQGTYIYFDYERWQIRKREHFMFEYKFLEDRDY